MVMAPVFPTWWLYVVLQQEEPQNDVPRNAMRECIFLVHVVEELA